MCIVTHRFCTLSQGRGFLCGGKFLACQNLKGAQRHHRSYDRCHGNQRSGGIRQHQRCAWRQQRYCHQQCRRIEYIQRSGCGRNLRLFVRLSDERGNLKAGHARQYSGHADSVPHVSRRNARPRRRFSSSGRNGSLHHMHDPFRPAQP